MAGTLTGKGRGGRRTGSTNAVPTKGWKAHTYLASILYVRKAPPHLLLRAFSTKYRYEAGFKSFACTTTTGRPADGDPFFDQFFGPVFGPFFGPFVCVGSTTVPLGCGGGGKGMARGTANGPTPAIISATTNGPPTPTK